MTLDEFKKSVDASKLVEAKTLEQTSVRNNIEIPGMYCFFQALTKKDSNIISSDGGTWDEVYSKLPDWLKRVKKV